MTKSKAGIGTVKIQDLLNTRPPCVVKIINFLDSLPDDEVLKSNDLLAALNIGLSTLGRAKNFSEVKPYKTIIGTTAYWGNKTAIKTLESSL